MNAFTSKANLLDAIASARAALESALARLDDRTLAETVIAGEWTGKDIMTHVADWERRFLRWVEIGRRGEIPQRPEPGISWAEEDRLNQSVVEHGRARSLDEVRAEFAAAYRAIWQALAAMSQDELLAPGHYAWTGDEPLAQIAWGVTGDHYAGHTADILAWLAQHSTPTDNRA
ncbi:MAG: hypothetical protein KatS3mg051_0977 [Anaerolineae bacterium]|nr:MAG: hypothetical protein KatS3mg051_0977 [Anaerolineae bacterium]